MYVEVITSIETRKLNKSFTYKVPMELVDNINIGQSVVVPFGKNNAENSAIIIKIIDIPKDLNIEYKSVLRVNEKKTEIDKNLLKLAVKIKDKYYLALSSILKLMTINNIKIKADYTNKIVSISDSGKIYMNSLRKSNKKALLLHLDALGKDKVRNLLDAGYKKSLISELINNNILIYESMVLVANKVDLSIKQNEVFNNIKESIDKENKDIYLLFGATGSGKTEIYFKTIEETLKNNKQVIVLLPEINLTENMIDRFEEAFPDNVVKWHSQVTSVQKRKAWDQLVNREKNIIIGPRSAIFTNMAEVGLIIVDEEHDTSYYQQNYPNYNGRDVALMRGDIENAIVILGSATPSVESMQMVNEGKYKLLSLAEKYYGQKNPEINIVDMKEELHKGNSTIISDALETSIRDKVKNGEQILIYINRRGYYNFIMCRDCGHVIKCEKCDIPMTYHEKEKKLICHYCDNKIDKEECCPNCGGKRIRGIGLGTEQAVELIKKKFPDLIVKRLDSDVNGGYTSKKIILQEYKDKKINILVGTQIIAKGIDFPNVGLVGILLGDMSLNFPDFRAREWTFQILMQVIGRTSRRDKKGDVILQTYLPSDIIYGDIKNFNYEHFYNQELKFRKKHNYPPFGEIFRIQYIGTDREKIIADIWDAYEYLSTKFSKNEIYQPKPNRIEKYNDSFRWQILIKVNRENLHIKEEYLKKYMEKYYEKTNSRELVYIERNPYGLL